MGRRRRLLLLGGTTEAADLARCLAGRPDLIVVTSLAGRTSQPSVPPGELRIGGFGGVAGLLQFLVDAKVDLVVDATHPFAARMRWHAEQACGVAGVPRIRLERPAWGAAAGDRWTPAQHLADAGRIVSGGDAHRVLLTTGRSDLAAFVPAVDGRRWWLIRCIDPPERQPLHPAEILLDRGPYDFSRELRLLQRHGIDLLVTKNSGGVATRAKLDAARALRVEVVMVARPGSPAGPTVATAEEAVRWVDAGSQPVTTAGYRRGV